MGDAPGAERTVFYCADKCAAEGPPAPEGDYQTLLWRPRLTSLTPPVVRDARWCAWWAMHQLHIFPNRDYSVFTVYQGDTLIHRAGLFPRYLRFPFMSDDDLQIGDVWTDPRFRGRGFAAWSIHSLLAAAEQPNRRFWYLTPPDNLASRRAAEKAGFQVASYGRRVRRLGVRVLGAYVFDGPEGPTDKDGGIARQPSHQSVKGNGSSAPLAPTPQPPPSGAYLRRWKRPVDALVAGGLLVGTSPVLAAIAVIIRRDGGPALYRAVRVGRNGVHFEMLKFRTMVMDADKIGPPSTADDDRRITPLGRQLRRYKLDELPQLINVVRGEMSLVGPRPEIVAEVESYDAIERRLLDARPGITDYASIVFSNEGEILRGSDDPHAAYRELIRPGKVSLGLHYVASASAAADLKILGLTAVAMVSPSRARKRILRSVPVTVPEAVNA